MARVILRGLPTEVHIRTVTVDVASGVLAKLPAAWLFDADVPSFCAARSNAFRSCGPDGVSSAGSETHPAEDGTTCPPPGNEPAVGGYDAASTTLIDNA